MRVGLVGCVKTKRSQAAAAAELYTSPLFRGRRAAVESSCDRWYVLSALHGLVAPDRVLEPYDLALTDVPTAGRRAWAAKVVAALEDELGDVAGHTFEIHAGAAYTDHGLARGLREKGAEVEVPTAGLSLGQQLAWYAGGSGEVSGAPSAAKLRATATSSSGRRDRYAPLRDHLETCRDPWLTLPFETIEELLGAPLPASARKHRAWWGNGGHRHADAWLTAGYEVDTVDQRSGRVRFRRVR